MTIGSQPIDNGNYLFTTDEKALFLTKEPDAECYFRRWYGSKEFINGKEKWVLWLGDVPTSELVNLPEVLKLVQAVKDYRLRSKRKQTFKAAERPQNFGTEIIHRSNALIVPEVSSENRKYIPLGFIGEEALCSNKLKLIPNGTLYHFGVLHSRVHNAWMRAVSGRMKSDYSYSSGVVYNNFIWPTVTARQEQVIADLAQGIFDARASYPGATLAQMYKVEHDFLYPELMAAHAALDAAVEQAYGLEPGLDEQAIVAYLFELYDEAVNKPNT